MSGRGHIDTQLAFVSSATAIAADGVAGSIIDTGSLATFYGRVQLDISAAAVGAANSAIVYLQGGAESDFSSGNVAILHSIVLGGASRTLANSTINVANGRGRYEMLFSNQVALGASTTEDNPPVAFRYLRLYVDVINGGGITIQSAYLTPMQSQS